MSDVIPTIHEKASNKRILELQPVLMLLGAVLVAISIQVAHGYLEHTDAHDHAGEHSLTEEHVDEEAHE